MTKSLNPNGPLETTTFTGSNSNLYFNQPDQQWRFWGWGNAHQYALTFPAIPVPTATRKGIAGLWGYLFCSPSVHQFCHNCTPHGGSNMMMLNGASSLQELWCQTIANAQYRLCIPGILKHPSKQQSRHPSICHWWNPAGARRLRFLPLPCNWQEFYEIWNSGSQYQHRICITNQNTAGGGNDFCTRWHLFGPICKDSMDFTVYVSEMQVEPPSDGSSIVPLQRHSWK